MEITGVCIFQIAQDSKSIKFQNALLTYGCHSPRVSKRDLFSWRLLLFQGALKFISSIATVSRIAGIQPSDFCDLFLVSGYFAVFYPKIVAKGTPGSSCAFGGFLSFSRIEFIEANLMRGSLAFWENRLVLSTSRLIILTLVGTFRVDWCILSSSVAFIKKIIVLPLLSKKGIWVNCPQGTLHFLSPGGELSKKMLNTIR